MNILLTFWCRLAAFYFLTAVFSIPSSHAASSLEPTKNLPVAYQGRFRSAEAASRLWLYEFYHQQLLKRSDLSEFLTDNRDPLQLLWKVHFHGHFSWDAAPFFWIHYADVKSLLDLDSAKERFNFNTLFSSLYENKASNQHILAALIRDEFLRVYSAQKGEHAKIELPALAPGLWVAFRNQALVIIKTPKFPPWHFLNPGFVVAEKISPLERGLEPGKKTTAEEIAQLFRSLDEFAEYQGPYIQTEEDYEIAFHELASQGLPANIIAETLEHRYPLSRRLQTAGKTLKMLPSKRNPGEWYSLHAFHVRIYHPLQQRLVPVQNFTPFSDDQFHRLRTAYLALENGIDSPAEELKQLAEIFAMEMKANYSALVETPYKQAVGKALFYPSLARLEAETFYYEWPLIDWAIGAYALALFLFLLNSAMPGVISSRLSLFFTLLGFALHTGLLALRCYVLQRPPVSNMFETVVYVPWIALLLGLIFYFTLRIKIILAAACLVSLALLVLLELTHIDSSMENVQAVLDSQYWLIIHVLMVVGSYGAFVVSGILGHFFLIAVNREQTTPSSLDQIARGILYTMYVGIALLIPGTILGGVWAAESWGRFWDWDPKESWAFISACVYLLFLHSYIFKRIQDFGLAVGSVTGLMAISFTWYGVNYVLGTGLHSYGFGRGGEFYYFLYLALEAFFLAGVCLWRKSILPRQKLLEKN
jgi:ABC-type transport system involved in cytochrome c biogenesis permease subunit